MNKFKPWKFLPIWLAVSAVLIVAGIILTALLGFNVSAQQTTQLEVRYNIVVINDEDMQNTLDSYCMEAFEEFKVSPCNVQEVKGTGETQDRNAFIYTFTQKVPVATQGKIKTEIASKIAANRDLSGDYVDIYTVWHTENVASGASYVWRGAIAVGIVAALIYVGFRFGVGCALTGLAVSLDGALLPVALLAITRIPVYAAAPVWYAAVGAVLSLAFWLIYCIKLRTVRKESETPVDADTAVETAYRGTWLQILVSAGIVAVIVLLAGLIASAGVRAMALPLLLSVVSAVYSVLLLGTAVQLPVRRAFDKLSRSNKTKYVGKEKKADK